MTIQIIKKPIVAEYEKYIQKIISPEMLMNCILITIRGPIDEKFLVVLKYYPDTEIVHFITNWNSTPVMSLSDKTVTTLKNRYEKHGSTTFVYNSMEGLLIFDLDQNTNIEPFWLLPSITKEGTLKSYAAIITRYDKNYAKTVTFAVIPDDYDNLLLLVAMLNFSDRLSPGEPTQEGTKLFSELIAGRFGLSPEISKRTFNLGSFILEERYRRSVSKDLHKLARFPSKILTSKSSKGVLFLRETISLCKILDEVSDAIKDYSSIEIIFGDDRQIQEDTDFFSAAIPLLEHLAISVINDVLEINVYISDSEDNYIYARSVLEETIRSTIEIDNMIVNVFFLDEQKSIIVSAGSEG